MPATTDSGAVTADRRNRGHGCADVQPPRVTLQRGQPAGTRQRRWPPVPRGGLSVGCQPDGLSSHHAGRVPGVPVAGNGQGTLVYWRSRGNPACPWRKPAPGAHPLGSRPRRPAEPISRPRGVRAPPTSALRRCGQLLSALDIVEWQLGSRGQSYGFMLIIAVIRLIAPKIGETFAKWSENG